MSSGHCMYKYIHQCELGPGPCTQAANPRYATALLSHLLVFLWQKQFQDIQTAMDLHHMFPVIAILTCIQMNWSEHDCSTFIVHGGSIHVMALINWLFKELLLLALCSCNLSVSLYSPIITTSTSKISLLRFTINVWTSQLRALTAMMMLITTTHTIAIYTTYLIPTPSRISKDVQHRAPAAKSSVKIVVPFSSVVIVLHIE